LSVDVDDDEIINVKMMMMVMLIVSEEMVGFFVGFFPIKSTNLVFWNW